MYSRANRPSSRFDGLFAAGRNAFGRRLNTGEPDCGKRNTSELKSAS